MSITREETRRTLLDAGLALAEERGMAHVRMEDVGRAAGVSRQTVYLHFGSRAGLLVALAAHLDDVRGRDRYVARIAKAGSALEMLDAAVEMVARFDPVIAEFARAIDAARDTDEAAAAVWSDRMALRAAGARRMVERLASEGLLLEELDVAVAADLLAGLLSFELWYLLVREKRWSRARYTRHVKALVRRALVDEEAARAS